MKRSTVIIYSVLISTIFVISLSFFGYNIYNELKHGNERTRKTFQHFTSKIEKIAKNRINGNPAWLEK